MLDATVIIASFVIDFALRGGLEEAGSLIIVLRLWRVFKIIEEFSAGADDQMEQLHEYISMLQRENEELVQENQTLKAQSDSSLK
jgi:voltage-gated hydrogen channel 1